MHCLRVVVVGLALLGAPAAVDAAQPPATQSPAREGFVPVDQLPPGQEEMPAVPLVAAAYGVAWAAILLYLLSIWRRLGAVEREIAEVARRVETRGR